jgi:CRISPR/Cas system-associated exonuclease Cas4 (RecB family)
MSQFTWSYSALKDYVNCPKQYQEVKVLKRFTKKPTQQILYGLEVHKAIEDYVKDGKPLAKNYERFQPILNEFLSIEGTKYPEYRMAVTEDGTPCAFNAKDCWVRGIIDLLIVDGDHAFVVDWKTGSNKYPDPKQLKLMALMVFAHFPEVKHVKSGLMFVMHNSFMPENYKREEIENLWGYFTGDLKRLALSYENDKW